MNKRLIIYGILLALVAVFLKDMAKNPVLHGLITMMEPLPIGIIVSLIASLIISYKRKPLPATHS